jgi:hypothetical protein
LDIGQSNCQGFIQSRRQVIDFVHCAVECHASFTKQSLSSTLDRSLAVTTACTLLECVDTYVMRIGFITEGLRPAPCLEWFLGQLLFLVNMQSSF